MIRTLLNTPGLLQLTTPQDQQQPVPMPTSRSKLRSTPHHQHKKGRAHHAHPAAATWASSQLTCAIQDCRTGVQGTARSPSCVSGIRLQLLSVTGCRQLHSSDIDTCLVQRTNTHLGDHSFAAAGPHVWNSLPIQLRELDSTLGQFRQALKTHLWSLTAAALSDSVLCALCTNLLTYILT